MTTQQRLLGRSFVDVRSLVFWSMVALSAYGLVHITPLLSRTALVYPTAGMLAALLWAAYGLVLAVVIYKLELFERRSPLTMFGAFVWGAVVVSGIGVIAAPAAHELVAKLLPESLAADWTAAFAAPLVEEPLKMLGVVALALIPGARINSAVDGLFFGLIVGLGFEVTESFMYTTAASTSDAGSLSLVVLTFLLRGVVGGLWNHPTFTAITGAGVGYFFGSAASLAKRTLVMVGSLIGAIILHGIFDSPILDFDNAFITTIVKGVPVLVLAFVVYKIAQKRERRLFETIAADDVPSDLISADELGTLTTRKGRRKARKTMRKKAGFAGAHALKRLQRRQSELISLTVEEGTESERTIEASDEIRQARSDLQQVVASHAT